LWYWRSLSRRCATSTIPNWLQEIEVWTDFRAATLFSSEPTRKVMKNHLFFKQMKDGTVDQSQMVVDIVVISYEMVKIEADFLKSIQFIYSVLTKHSG
jgi:SNF2 family DNA or RNA helicase